LEVEDINVLHFVIVIDDQPSCSLIDPDAPKVHHFFDGHSGLASLLFLAQLSFGFGGLDALYDPGRADLAQDRIGRRSSRTRGTDPISMNERPYLRCMANEKPRAGRNRTIELSDVERASYRDQVLEPTNKLHQDAVLDQVIKGDIFATLELLPDSFVDLLFVDPPYNMDKVFGDERFKEMNDDQYAEWLDAWVSKCIRLLKPNASVYICGDWKCSSAIQRVAEKYFIVRNRITWEREKGRGALSNWKNSSEDIWFCTMGKDYHFDAEAVKLKRKVVAPYTDERGAPKDWERSEQGSFRLTHPSNLWTDLTVPFWSMPENTDHPTQKPEKLVAKAILASSRPGDVVFDPFLGSGTTAVVAKKLGRRFTGIEIDETYACIALKRLDMANNDPNIQGYTDGVFWERNSGPQQAKAAAKNKPLQPEDLELFDMPVQER